jgi:ACS family glucarate transporter-like MFS transporter
VSHYRRSITNRCSDRLGRAKPILDSPTTSTRLISPKKESTSANLRPTTVRWRIMAMVAVANMLPSLGRISMGVTAKYIQDEFRFSNATMGWVLSAFWLSYALFQVPGGWAGDRYGPRKVLTLAILWYSLFLATMALVPRLPMSRWLGLAWSFAAIQFLIGAGEAFTPPTSAKVVGSWMSTGKLGLGISFTTLGIGAGGVLTPMFIAWTMQRWGWRTSFWLCGMIGTLVALGWGSYVTDRPEEHPHVNALELALLRPRAETHHGRSKKTLGTGGLPWRRMLLSHSTWALFLSYACRAYTMYFFNTWFFIYLVRVRGLTIMQGGLWGATPFLAVLLLSPVGGWVSDLAVRHFGKRRGRQTAVWLGMACSATLVWIGCHTADNTLAILLVASAAGFNMFANVSWWATCIDLTPNYAGSLSGLMNMCGGFGGWLAPILTAYIATSFGWARALDLIAVLTVIGGLLWIFVNAGERLEEEPASCPVGQDA